MIYRHFLLPFLITVACLVAVFVMAVFALWVAAVAWAVAAAGWFVAAVLLAEDPDQGDTP